MEFDNADLRDAAHVLYTLSGSAIFRAWIDGKLTDADLCTMLESNSSNLADALFDHQLEWSTVQNLLLRAAQLERKSGCQVFDLDSRVVISKIARILEEPDTPADIRNQEALMIALQALDNTRSRHSRVEHEVALMAG